MMLFVLICAGVIPGVVYAAHGFLAHVPIPRIVEIKLDEVNSQTEVTEEDLALAEQQMAERRAQLQPQLWRAMTAFVAMVSGIVFAVSMYGVLFRA